MSAFFAALCSCGLNFRESDRRVDHPRRKPQPRGRFRTPPEPPDRTFHIGLSLVESSPQTLDHTHTKDILPQEPRPKKGIQALKLVPREAGQSPRPRPPPDVQAQLSVPSESGQILVSLPKESGEAPKLVPRKNGQPPGRKPKKDFQAQPLVPREIYQSQKSVPKESVHSPKSVPKESGETPRLVPREIGRVPKAASQKDTRVQKSVPSENVQAQKPTPRKDTQVQKQVPRENSQAQRLVPRANVQVQEQALQKDAQVSKSTPKGNIPTQKLAPREDAQVPKSVHKGNVQGQKLAPLGDTGRQKLALEKDLQIQKPTYKEVGIKQALRERYLQIQKSALEDGVESNSLTLERYLRNRKSALKEGVKVEKPRSESHLRIPTPLPQKDIQIPKSPPKGTNVHVQAPAPALESDLSVYLRSEIDPELEYFSHLSQREKSEESAGCRRFSDGRSPTRLSEDCSANHYHQETGAGTLRQDYSPEEDRVARSQPQHVVDTIDIANSPSTMSSSQLIVPGTSDPNEAEIKRREYILHAAEDQQKKIVDQCRKEKAEIPKYELLELIGRGAYGRVYKSRHLVNNQVFAVKIIDSEAMDSLQSGTPQAIQATLKEIEILRQLQKSNTVNVNTLVDAFNVLSSIWIVSEYCPGGSLTTLRRAGINQLPERFILPIARELAIALKSIHAAGIVHRDLKCSNVMINENGNLEVIDFGVAGLMQTNMEIDKRTTIVGTEHWMPPEMHRDVRKVAHSYEVDVWAFGITIYECAMGAPPNARKMGRQLHQAVRNQPPKLSSDKFSEDLCDLISFVCELDPQKRPTMAQVCEHKYIANTTETFPTSILSELVERYYAWASQGNQRSSIIPNGFGAEPIEFSSDVDSDDWNFSYTDQFMKRMSLMPFDNVAQRLASAQSSRDEPFIEETVKGPLTETSNQKSATKAFNDVTSDVRVARGKNAMQGLFDKTLPSYDSDWRNRSDLPFRNSDGSDSLHRKEVSINSNHGQPTISLNDPPKQAKRDTQAWTFEANAPPPRPTQPEDQMTAFQFPSASPPLRPQLQHSATEPIGGGFLGNQRANISAAHRGTLNIDDLMAQTGDDEFTFDMNPDISVDNDVPHSGWPSFSQIPGEGEQFMTGPKALVDDLYVDSFENDMGGLQLDIDAGFHNFDEARPAVPIQPEQSFSSMFEAGPPLTEPLPSQASTRLPSPEIPPSSAMTSFADYEFRNSPPPASPVDEAPAVRLSSARPLNGGVTRPGSTPAIEMMGLELRSSFGRVNDLMAEVEYNLDNVGLAEEVRGGDGGVGEEEDEDEDGEEGVNGDMGSQASETDGSIGESGNEGEVDDSE